MDRDDHVMASLAGLMEEARDRILEDGDGGLRPSHHRILDGVPADGPVTVTELAARVGMTKQAIGQFVTQLAGAPVSSGGD